jgi:hypothetical protein
MATVSPLTGSVLGSALSPHPWPPPIRAQPGSQHCLHRPTKMLFIKIT